MLKGIRRKGNVCLGVNVSVDGESEVSSQSEEWFSSIGINRLDQA